MTVDTLLPGHKLILQSTIDQIIKVLETIITFIQTESYEAPEASSLAEIPLIEAH